MSRDRVVSVRLTEAERDHLRLRAETARRSLSAYLRETLLREPAPVALISGYGGGSITLPSVGNVIWLSDGRQDGNTLTVAA